MSTHIYFETIDGSILDNYQISFAAKIVDGMGIYDFKDIREYASRCKGIVKEIKDPSIEDFLKHGNKIAAIKLYYRTHPEFTLKECKEFIEELQDKIKKEGSNE